MRVDIAKSSMRPIVKKSLFIKRPKMSFPKSKGKSLRLKNWMRNMLRFLLRRKRHILNTGRLARRWKIIKRRSIISTDSFRLRSRRNKRKSKNRIQRPDEIWGNSTFIRSGVAPLFYVPGKMHLAPTCWCVAPSETRFLGDWGQSQPTSKERRW